MDLGNLVAIGKTFALEGSALKQFVDDERAREKAEQDNERDQRAVERDNLKEEQALLKLKIELEELRSSNLAGVGNVGQSDDAAAAAGRAPKLPVFQDGKDQMDAYLNRFERYAKAQQWPVKYWAANLSALLSGKALETYARIDEDDSRDYTKVKQALLERYSLTSEGFRKKLRAAKPESGESASQFVSRMRSYLNNWMRLSGLQPGYENLIELVLMEQFYSSCSSPMATFIKESRPRDLDRMVDAADRYIESRTGWNVHPSSKGQPNGELARYSPSPETGDHQNKPVSGPKGGGAPRKGACFICGSPGHMARDCNKRPRAEKLGAGLDEPNPRTGEDSDETVRREGDSKGTKGEGRNGSNQGSRSGENGFLLLDSCFSCNLKADAGTADQALPGAASGATPVRVMPVARGLLNGREVEVLRDSGCSTTVAKTDLIDPSQMTDQKRTCILIDGTVRTFPVAEVVVDTPYYTGRIEVLVVENPVYDLILGNVPGVRPPNEPDGEWEPSDRFRHVEEEDDTSRRDEPGDEIRHGTPLDVAATAVVEDEGPADDVVHRRHESREPPFHLLTTRQTRGDGDVSIGAGLRDEQRERLGRLKDRGKS